MFPETGKKKGNKTKTTCLHRKTKPVGQTRREELWLWTTPLTKNSNLVNTIVTESVTFFFFFCTTHPSNSSKQTPKTQSQKWNKEILIWLNSEALEASHGQFSCPSNIFISNIVQMCCSEFGSAFRRKKNNFFLSIQQPQCTNTKCKAISFVQQTFWISLSYATGNVWI